MAKKARQVKLLKNTNRDGDEKEKKKKKTTQTEDRGVFLWWDSSADQRYDEQTTEREGKGGLLHSASRPRLHRGRQLIIPTIACIFLYGGRVEVEYQWSGVEVGG